MTVSAKGRHVLAMLGTAALALAAPAGAAKPPPKATATVSVDRTAPDAMSRWVPGHTVVSNEFYFPWGLNQGPDTLPGTAQYNARANEVQGVAQHNVHIMAGRAGARGSAHRICRPTRSRRRSRRPRRARTAGAARAPTRRSDARSTPG